MSPSLIRIAGVFAFCCSALLGAALAQDAADINRLFRAGQTSEAFTKLDQLLAGRPKDPQLRFLKAVMLADSQRGDEARSIFEQLTIEFPELPEPYNNLAVLYAAQGSYDKARAALEAALRAQPGYAVAQENLGDVYVQLAREAYANAMRLAPTNASIAPKLALLRDLGKPLSNAATKADRKADSP